MLRYLGLFALLTGAMAGCGSADPRFAERPLLSSTIARHTGFAFVHDARITAIGVRDPSRDVVDHVVGRHFETYEAPPTRSTHFGGRRVFWSSRPLGTNVATVFTMPPGNYEIIAWYERPVVDDTLGGLITSHAISVVVPLRIPYEGIVAGALRCADASCTFETSLEARTHLRDVIAWELTQPHAASDIALWQSWLPAVDATLASPQEGFLPTAVAQ